MAIPAFPPGGGNEGIQCNSPLRQLRPGRRRPGRGRTLTIRTRGCALEGRRSRPAAGTIRRNTTARLRTRPPSRRWTGGCGFLAIHARGCALGSQRSRRQAGTKGRDATAHSDRVHQIVAGPGVVAAWPSIPEAAPWGSRRSRTTAGTRQKDETAHSGHALRQVTPPFVPLPSSARMAASRAMRSRHASPVRCSPTAALRCGLRGVHDRARVFATPASRLRVHGDVPASACAPLLSVCSTERQPQRRGARSGPTPDPRPKFR